MLKIKRLLTIFTLTILLIINHAFNPLISISIVNALENVERHELFQVSEDIELENGIIIKNGTYLYGIIDGEVIGIQFGDSYISIPVDSVKEVLGLIESPDFHEFKENYSTAFITENTSLYSIQPDENDRIVINNAMQIPVSINDLGLEVVYIGNIEFYLTIEDRERAEELSVKYGSEDHSEILENDLEKEDENFNNIELNEDNLSKNEEQITNDRSSTDRKLIEGNINNNRLVLTDNEIEKVVEENKSNNNYLDAKYFKVITNTLTVYGRDNNGLIPIGKLLKDQVYPLINKNGNWIEIRFGNKIGYVWSKSTEPSNKQAINNENTNYRNEIRSFKGLKDVVVYDNTSSTLVPFGIIDKDQNYPIVGDYGNWWRVIFADRVGYVNKKEVAVQFLANDKYFKVDNDSPIYDNRTGKLVKVGEVKKGQVYPRVSDYGNWHRIQFGNIYGYVSKSGTSPAAGNEIKNLISEYKFMTRSIVSKGTTVVYDNTSGKLVPFGTIVRGVEYPLVKDYGNWWQIVYAGRIGYVSKNSTNLNFDSSDKYFIADIDLPIYDNRTGKLVKVGEVKKGQVYPRVSDYGNWHRIQFGNIYGYVSKSGTSPATGNEIKNLISDYKLMTRSIVSKGPTVVYDNTSGKLVPFGNIERGIEYPLVKDYGNWWQIVYAGRVGYVSKKSTNLAFLSSDKFFRADTDLPIYDNRTGQLVKVGEVKKGQVYPRVSDYGNWHRIKFGKIYGYVSKLETTPTTGDELKNLNHNFSHGSRSLKALQVVTVYDNTSGKLVPFGTINKNRSYPIAGDYGKWWIVDFADRIGYVNKDHVQVEFKSTDKYFKAIRDLDVYENRKGQLVKVGTIYKGQVYQITSEYGENWWRVQFGNGYGYVHKANTGYASHSEIYNLNNGYKNSDIELFTINDVNIYDNTSSQSIVMGKIEKGLFYPIVSEEINEWIKIIYLGRIGFIRKSDVHVMNDFDLDIIIEQYKNKNTDESIDRISRFFISPSYNYLSVSNNIIEKNEYYISGYGSFVFSNGIPWHEIPENVDNRNSYLRILHAHYFINDLVEAYKVTNDKKYIKKGYEIIEDWIRKNPYNTTQNNRAWHDEGTARRLVTWINFYDSARQILSEEQLRLLLNSMDEHVKILKTDSFHTSLTNHGMFQDEAILAYSDYFNVNENSLIYRTLAKKRLKEYFDFIISSEGVHLEHSPAYHQVIANSVKKYSDYFTKINDKESAEYYNSLYNKMSTYQTWILKPDGKFPLIGDTFINNEPNKSLWLDNENYIYSLTSGNEGAPPDSNSIVFPKAGYAIFRDNWNNGQDDTYILFTAAYHTDYHKHSDDLNVWIYTKGYDVVTESGPNGYQYDLPLTQYAYSSYAHNTLIVNDQGLPRVDGKFGQTYISDYYIGDTVSSVEGVNKRFENVIHYRNLEYNRETNVISVTDRISSNKRNNYKVLWNFADGVELTSVSGEENQYRILVNDKELMTMKIESNENIKIKIVKGLKDEKDNYLLGWHIKETNNPIPVNTVIIEVDSIHADIQTTFTILE